MPTDPIFEEKGEPKRNRTEVLLLTSLTPYRYAKPAHQKLLEQTTLHLIFAFCIGFQSMLESNTKFLLFASEH